MRERSYEAERCLRLKERMKKQRVNGGTSAVSCADLEALDRSRAVLPDDILEDLLEKTSRTFAASIPLLDEPTRRWVGLAYLLLRIADNFEDAASWGVEDRVTALRRFLEVLEPTGAPLSKQEVIDWVKRRPQDHPGYLELLRRAPQVVAASRATGDKAWALLSKHVARSTQGMIDTVQRADGRGSLELKSMQDLKDYCYLVAGIVGELLTDLFVLAAPGLEQVRGELEQRAALFGEALQLVNIVKDAAGDAVEGRQFLPDDVALDEVFRVAREDLLVAQEYVELMRRVDTPSGHIAFTALPVRLAWATLRAVEKRGSGAKISRLAVATHLRAVRVAVKKGRPLFEEVPPQRLA